MNRIKIDRTKADRIKAALAADHAWLRGEILKHRTKLQAQLAKARACFPARAWVGGKTMREAWEQCPRIDWMKWKLFEHTDLAHMYIYTFRTCDEMRAAIPFERLRQLVAEKFPGGAR